MDIEEELAQTVLDHFHAPDDLHSSWWINTDEMAAALMPLVRRAQADKVREAAELVMDPRDGLPFNADHDLAIVSAWLDETADRIEQEAGA